MLTKGAGYSELSLGTVAAQGGRLSIMRHVDTIKLGQHSLGPTHPPFVVAEMSGNHNQDLGRALKIVEAAAASGAHAIKLQTYTADTMTLDISRDEFVTTTSTKKRTRHGNGIRQSSLVPESLA